MILHQLLVLSLVGTLGDFLGHAIVNQTLYLTTDTACLAFVAEADINIKRSKGIGQTAIAYPCLLLVRTTRSLLSFLIVVVLLANGQEEVLLESIVGINY